MSLVKQLLEKYYMKSSITRHWAVPERACSWTMIDDKQYKIVVSKIWRYMSFQFACFPLACS
jgi:hypothetical protein